MVFDECLPLITDTSAVEKIELSGKSEINDDTVLDEVSLPKDACLENAETSGAKNIDDNLDDGKAVQLSEEIKISVTKSEIESKDDIKLSKNAQSIISDLSELPKGNFILIIDWPGLGTRA